MCAAIGSAVVVSWLVGFTPLHGLLPGWPTMTANTATSIALLGVGCWALSRGWLLAALGCALPVFGVSAASLWEQATGADLGLDQLLARDPVGAAAGLAPGRMSPGTAIELALISLALVLTGARRPRAAQALCGVALISLALPLASFSYFSRALHQTALYSTMAIHTALCLGMLAASLLLSRPGWGVARFLTQPTSGAHLVRKLSLPLLAGVWIIGFAVFGLVTAGRPAQLALSLSQVAHLALAAGLLAWGGRSLTRAEAELREKEERFRALIEAAPDALLVRDARGRIQLVNSRAESMFGVPRDALREREFLSLLAPESHEAYMREMALRDAAPADDPLWERTVPLVGRGPSGSFPLDLRVRRLVGEAEPSWLHTLRDVSERQAMEEQVRHAQKMGAIGQLAGGIAHDYNNIVHVIDASASFLAEDLDPEHPSQADVAEIRRAAGEAAQLSRQLLGYSRRQMLDPKPHSLSHIVRSLERVLRGAIGDDVRLALHLDEGLWSARIDEGHFEQILFNLATNARHAMPDGGTLSIETSNVILDEVYAEAHPGVTAGEHVLLAVTDTGVGMSREVRQQIFEPFFTTKERGRGTGLGLSMCYGIVHQLGGHMWVYSEPGEGSTFKIYLPRSVDPSREPTPPRVPAVPPLGTGTILVVEDEPALLAVVSRTLRGGGYEVIEASDITQALTLARSAETLDLVITDVVMHGGSGIELARRLRAVRSVPLVMMSGYTENALFEDGMQKADGFLGKPFSGWELLTEVQRVLGRRDEPTS